MRAQEHPAAAEVSEGRSLHDPAPYVHARAAQVREGAVGDVALLRDNGGKHGAHLPTGSGLTVPYARGRVARLRVGPAHRRGGAAEGAQHKAYPRHAHMHATQQAVALWREQYLGRAIGRGELA